MKAARGRNLFFSTDISCRNPRIRGHLRFGQHSDQNLRQGAGKAADLQYWEKVAREILRESSHPRSSSRKARCPSKPRKQWKTYSTPTGEKIHFEVISNPEFLAEGTAVKDLLEPDRVLIGSRETPEGLRARQEIVDIYANWVPRDRILTSNVWSAELSKLVANAFLAQRISSINSISALCEKTDANVLEVARAVGMDSRIGSRFPQRQRRIRRVVF